jgi:tetratricopeptide (TPR) repeat protein
MLRQVMIRVWILFILCCLPCVARGEVGRWISEGVMSFDEAYRTWNSDEFAKAAGMFERASQEHPRSAEAWYWLGVARFHRMLVFQVAAQKKSEETEREHAEAAFEFLLELDPSHAEAHALMATLQGMKIQGSALRALRYGPSLQRHHRRAMEAGANNPRVRYLSGVGLYHVAKEPDEYRKALAELRVAENLYQKEAVNHPAPNAPRWGRASTLTFSAMALEKLGRTQEAVAEFRRALNLHSGDRKASAGLARLGATP